MGKGDSTCQAKQVWEKVSQHAGREWTYCCLCNTYIYPGWHLDKFYDIIQILVHEVMLTSKFARLRKVLLMIDYRSNMLMTFMDRVLCTAVVPARHIYFRWCSGSCPRHIYYRWCRFFLKQPEKCTTSRRHLEYCCCINTRIVHVRIIWSHQYIRRYNVKQERLRQRGRRNSACSTINWTRKYSVVHIYVYIIWYIRNIYHMISYLWIIDTAVHINTKYFLLSSSVLRAPYFEVLK